MILSKKSRSLDANLGREGVWGGGFGEAWLSEAWLSKLQREGLGKGWGGVGEGLGRGWGRGWGKVGEASLSMLRQPRLKTP